MVNAINLDGGGSSTFVKDQNVINYPSDHWYVNIVLQSPEVLQSFAVMTRSIDVKEKFLQFYVFMMWNVWSLLVMIMAPAYVENVHVACHGLVAHAICSIVL